MPEPFTIDGFIVCEWDTSEPVQFVACTKDDPNRERVEMGLLRNMDTERYFLRDTRWAR